MSNLEPFEQPGSAVQISGDSVVVSSGAISVISGSITINSGQVAVSGLFAGFSGAQKFLSGSAAVSGAIPVMSIFYDYSGAQWVPQMVGASGYSVPLTMIADAGAVAGNSLGNYSRVQNQNATLVGPGLTTTTFLYAWDTVGIVGTRLDMMTLPGGHKALETNISGQNINVSGLFAGQSGSTKFLSGAGAFSGAIPVIPMVWDFSGNSWNQFQSHQSGSTTLVMTPDTFDYVWAPLSGIGFGAGATNSGIPSLSGGVVLSSGKVGNAVIRNMSGNADMYVGGSGSRPFSGFGFNLHGGDGLTLRIGNFNQIYVFAATSGQLVSYIGTAFN